MAIIKKGIQGKIIEYFSATSHGYIQKDTGGHVFFHLSEITNTNDVAVLDDVTFDENKNKRRAINIIVNDISDENWGVM